MAEGSEPRSSFTRLFQNWISWAGLFLAASATFAFLLLLAIDLFAKLQNPYVGILAYLIAPGFFFLGLLIACIGALIQRRKERGGGFVAKPPAIHIDLSRRRDRRILAVFAVGSVAFLFLTALGSYETYHFTESVEFCGTTCHVPMEPQYVAFQHSAHANVACVACHVGPGAAAYFKTKLNGVRQLYHTVLGDFSRPVFVNEINPRPPQHICEQCHWPEKNAGVIYRNYNHFLADEKNTPFGVRLVLNVGGGNPTDGTSSGIHWHMNIANKIEYIATDDTLQEIPWVRKTDPNGVVTEYRAEGFTDDLSKHRIRRMDCLDCHTRPAHKVESPNDAVDHALASGRLDPKVPWVKSKVVDALVKPYKNRTEAEQGITTALKAAYPDPAQAEPIIKQAQAIYRSNFFPEMKMDWRTHPDFIGHKDWNGCFRCHDGKHASADGNASIKASDCNSCHLIVAQGSAETINQVNPQGLTFFHVDSEYTDFSCADCHTGGIQK